MAKKKKGFKRVVIISDLHCGHRVGLTPPKYQNAIPGKKYYEIQQELWSQYERWIKELQPVDICFVNGDAIDGQGSRSGSSELIAVSANQQIEIASECIELVNADIYRFTYGTPYHVGVDNDYEKIVANNFSAKIESHGFWSVNGVNFDVKHKVPGTTVPYGKGTAISKESFWNLVWAEYAEQPRGDIFIRSHVHTHSFAGDYNWLGVVTPALQGQGSKFGARQCSGHVDFGLVYFDVYNDGSFHWEPRILVAESQKREAEKL